MPVPDNHLTTQPRSPSSKGCEESVLEGSAARFRPLAGSSVKVRPPYTQGGASSGKGLAPKSLNPVAVCAQKSIHVKAVSHEGHEGR